MSLTFLATRSQSNRKNGCTHRRSVSCWLWAVRTKSTTEGESQ